MPVPFSDWDQVDRNRLVLPIGGKQYSIPPLGHLDAIAIRRSQEAQQEINAMGAAAKDDPDLKVDLDKLAELQAEIVSDDRFLTMLLGPVREQMRDDNLPDKAIVHAAATAHIDATEGREVARAWWERGLDPEALAAELAAAQKVLTDLQTQATRSTPSRSTAAAKGTRRRGSSSGTRSRKATAPRKTPATKSISGK